MGYFLAVKSGISARDISPTDADGTPLLTRHTVGRLLRCSRATVRRYEGTRELKPIVIAGVHYFRRAEVVQLAEQRDGRIAARAWGLFRDGKGLVDVVLELQAEPDYVRALWEQYQQAIGMLVVQLPQPLEHWARVYHASLADFAPVRLLRALEICLSTPELRRQLDVMSAIPVVGTDSVSRETGT